MVRVLCLERRREGEGEGVEVRGGEGGAGAGGRGICCVALDYTVLALHLVWWRFVR